MDQEDLGPTSNGYWMGFGGMLDKGCRSIGSCLGGFWIRLRGYCYKFAEILGHDCGDISSFAWGRFKSASEGLEHVRVNVGISPRGHVGSVPRDHVLFLASGQIIIYF